MKEFSLGEYLANPKRKVVTRNGRTTEIVFTKGREPYVIIGYMDYATLATCPTVWTKEGKYNTLGVGEMFDLFFADEEEPIMDLPKWHRAGAGTRLPSEATTRILIDYKPNAVRRFFLRTLLWLYYHYEKY